MFTNGPGDLGSILGQNITKTKNMVLEASLLNVQHYKVGLRISESIQGKKSRPTQHFGVKSIEKGTFGSTSTTVG